ncbi:hypothetical protein ACFX2G_035922 [Malus domestica]
MLKLTNTKQWRDEPVVDYINRWHNLSLDCKDRLLEISLIELIAHHGKKVPIIDFKKDKVFSPNVDKTGKKPPRKRSPSALRPLRPPPRLSRSPLKPKQRR